MAVEGQFDRRNWMWNNSSTRSGITDKITCDKTMTNRNNKCRLCQQFDETVKHIIPACQILAKEHCIKRHDSGLNYPSTCARKSG